jgi:hypothetical protein
MVSGQAGDFSSGVALAPRRSNPPTLGPLHDRFHAPNFPRHLLNNFTMLRIYTSVPSRTLPPKIQPTALGVTTF